MRIRLRISLFISGIILTQIRMHTNTVLEYDYRIRIIPSWTRKILRPEHLVMFSLLNVHIWLDSDVFTDGLFFSPRPWITEVLISYTRTHAAPFFSFQCSCGQIYRSISVITSCDWTASLLSVPFDPTLPSTYSSPSTLLHTTYYTAED